MSYQKTIIVGHLGADAEVRYTAGGDAVATLRVATSEKWKDKQSGEAREHTEWHRCVAYGRLAEICGEYAQKGRLVAIEGQNRTDKYTDREGVERYSTSVRIRELKFLGGGKERGQRSESPGRGEPPPSDMDDDQIPF